MEGLSSEYSKLGRGLIYATESQASRSDTNGADCTELRNETVS